MANVVNAIINLIENPIISLKQTYLGSNRVNNVGDALENYVQDLFIGQYDLPNDERLQKMSEIFSYKGNTSNPPDLMLKGGDAIEVKKIESKNSDLAFNSSYPKAKLSINNPMITTACKTAEAWQQKDMLYAVGVMNNDNLQSLAFVYGDDYCADDEIYQAVKQRIKQGVETIEGVEFAETKELGRINKIDPLGITYLRVRGMWGIANPFKVFDYVYQRNFSQSFNFMAIINDEKWLSLSNRDALLQVIDKHDTADISDIKIKNPNNPAQLKSAKLIRFFVV